LLLLNNNLTSRPEWITDTSGKITGYKTPGGADTVFPFKADLQSAKGTFTCPFDSGGSAYSYAATHDKEYVFLFQCAGSLGGKSVSYTVATTGQWLQRDNTHNSANQSNADITSGIILLKKGQTVTLNMSGTSYGVNLRAVYIMW